MHGSQFDVIMSFQCLLSINSVSFCFVSFVFFSLNFLCEKTIKLCRAYFNPENWTFYQQADQICYSVLCVFSYVAAGSDPKKSSPLLQHKHAPSQPHVQQHHHQQQASKVQQTHLPQQPTTKLQTVVSKSGQASPKPVQVPLKQANQPVPVKAEAVQPPQKLPSVPPRKTSIPTSTSPPSSEPPKVKPPQLTESVKRTQSVSVPSRGPPPPIPQRAGSVQHPSTPTQQSRSMRRQSTINSAMPSCTPQPPPEFYIPQRRGSITRQQSSSSVTSTSSKLSK